MVGRSTRWCVRVGRDGWKGGLKGRGWVVGEVWSEAVGRAGHGLVGLVVKRRGRVRKSG